MQAAHRPKGLLTRNVIRHLVPLGILAIVVSRLPFVFYGDELNPDESMQMALARRIETDWLPWRAVDYTTSGPLNAGLLTLLHACGLPVSYEVVHGIALTLLIGILLVSWMSAVRLSGYVPGTLAFFGVALWIASCLKSDYTHYASELLPSFLIASGLALLIGNRGHCSVSSFRLAAGGLLLGLAPWAKLQAGPIALSACAWTAFALCSQSPASRRLSSCALLPLGTFTVGALAPTAVMVYLCHRADTLEYAWRSYILNSIAYAGSISLTGIGAHIRGVLQAPFVSGCVAFMAIGFILSPGLGLERRNMRRTWLLALLSTAALVAIFRSQYHFPHYEIFLLCPILLVVARLLQVTRLSMSDLGQSLRPRVFIALYVAGVGTPLLASAVASAADFYRTTIRDNAQYYAERSLGHSLTNMIPRRSTIYIWGWRPALYIHLDALPATRYILNAFLVQDTSFGASCRQLLLEDLDCERPEWIIVTKHTPYLNLGETPPFPALQALIEGSYRLKSKSKDLLVFRRIPDPMMPEEHPPR